jgi:Mrp family chromosome partitioning ATPase
VIETNRLRPSFSRLFGLADSRGLAAIGSGAAPALDCVQKDPTGLPLVPLGTRAAWEKLPGLASVLSGAMQELNQHFEFVIVDAPPILESADTLMAGKVVPHLVLVAEAGRVSQKSLGRVLQELTNAEITLVGAIMNSRRQIIPAWIDRWLTH